MNVTKLMKSNNGKNQEEALGKQKLQEGTHIFSFKYFKLSTPPTYSENLTLNFFIEIVGYKESHI